MRTPPECLRRWRSRLRHCTWDIRRVCREADRLLVRRRSRKPEDSSRSPSLELRRVNTGGAVAG
eukprot:6550981-Pyramimonas_sp.AAC.1